MSNLYYTRKLDEKMMSFKKRLPTIAELKRKYFRLEEVMERIEQCMMLDSVKFTFNNGTLISTDKYWNYRKDMSAEEKKFRANVCSSVMKLEPRILFNDFRESFIDYYLVMLNGNRLTNYLYNGSKPIKIDSLDGNDNVLQYSCMGNLGKSIRHFIYYEIFPAIEKICLIVQKRIDCRLGKDREVGYPAGMQLKLNHWEICLDIDTEIYSSHDFMRLYQAATSIYQIVSITSTTKNGTPKGAKFEITPGLYLTIYFKKTNVIRCEIKAEKKYLSQLGKTRTWADSWERFLYLEKLSSRIFKNIISEAVTFRSQLSHEDAFTELKIRIKEKYFSSLIKKVIEGDGSFIVKSSNQPQYREVKRLCKEGVFHQSPRQSTFHVDKRYWELIKIQGITGRTLRFQEI